MTSPISFFPLCPIYRFPVFGRFAIEHSKIAKRNITLRKLMWAFSWVITTQNKRLGYCWWPRIFQFYRDCIPTLKTECIVWPQCQTWGKHEKWGHEEEEGPPSAPRSTKAWVAHEDTLDLYFKRSCQVSPHSRTEKWTQGPHELNLCAVPINCIYILTLIFTF